MKMKKKNKNKKPICHSKSKPETPEFQRRGLSILRPPPQRRSNHPNDLNSNFKNPRRVDQSPNLLSHALRIEEQEHQINNKISDRISTLPDALIHQIMSHLDTRDVVHTSILSNRWRYIWLSTPYLNFDFDTWLIKCGRPSWTGRREAFIDFVDNVLIRRETLTSDDMFKFRLYSYDCNFSFDLPRVPLWLSMCLERNVQHMCLEFPLKLCNEIFTCIDSASTIKNLQLHGVKLPYGNADGELVLSCGGLEDLDMRNCDVHHLKTLIVSTPLLENLRLSLYTDRKAACKVKVEICTPKLKSIRLESCSSRTTSPVYYSVEDDLCSLVSAYIHILEDGVFDPIDECSESVVNIISRVYNAQALQLSICTKQVLTDFPVLSEGLPYKFQNLRHIMLVDRMQTPCIRAISNFLMSFPSIESLVWERSPCERYHEEADNAEESVANRPAESISSLSSKCIYSHLKLVKTLKLEGSDIELSFLAFLLERAIFLEEIIIEYSRTLSSENLAHFKERVMSLPQASLNVSVSFRMSVDPCLL